ncbi:MAG: hypothetical protein GY719_34930 [bacterium]|nr:hypothetical protein [bacterium]
MSETLRLDEWIYESQGVVRGVHRIVLRYGKDVAKADAAHWRSQGYRARVMARDIRADGLRLTVWIVIVRKAKGGAS